MSLFKRQYVLLYLILAAGAADADGKVTASVIEFGLDDTLFVGDSSAGMLYAYDLPNTGRARKTACVFVRWPLKLLVSFIISFRWIR